MNKQNALINNNYWIWYEDINENPDVLIVIFL